MSHEVKQGEIVIELNHPKNSDVVFQPINDKLRSRLLPGRSGANYPKPFNAFIGDGVPGQRIHIDRKSGVGRITDGIGVKDAKGVREQLETACRASGQPAVSNSYGPHEPQEKKLTEEDVWTWLFWMRRFMDLGWATEVQGKLPTDNEVRETGKAKRTRYDRRSKVPTHFMTDEKETAFVEKLSAS